MLDNDYFEWFDDQFDAALALTWCSATSLDDVLAAFNIPAEEARPATLVDIHEVRLLTGRIGKGTLVIQPNDSPTTETLTALAQHGPCLSVHWSDFVPARVSYRTRDGLVAAFDAGDWEFSSELGVESVERWVTTTPAGREIWEDNWALATLITAEALCQATVDDEWVRAVHLGVFNEASA